MWTCYSWVELLTFHICYLIISTVNDIRCLHLRARRMVINNLFDTINRSLAGCITFTRRVKMLKCALKLKRKKIFTWSRLKWKLITHATKNVNPKKKWSQRGNIFLLPCLISVNNFQQLNSITIVEWECGLKKV